MPRKPKAYVLDTWAVISYFQGEPAAEQLEELLADAHENKIPLFMTVVNAGEVWYIKARRSSPSAADVAIHELRQLGIEFIEADWALAKDAGYYKSRHKMSF